MKQVKITIEDEEGVREIVTTQYFLLTENGEYVTTRVNATIPWINQVFNYDLFCEMRDNYISGMLKQMDEVRI